MVSAQSKVSSHNSQTKAFKHWPTKSKTSKQNDYHFDHPTTPKSTKKLPKKKNTNKNIRTNIICNRYPSFSLQSQVHFRHFRKCCRLQPQQSRPLLSFLHALPGRRATPGVHLHTFTYYQLFRQGRPPMLHYAWLAKAFWANMSNPRAVPLWIHANDHQSILWTWCKNITHLSSLRKLKAHLLQQSQSWASEKVTLSVGHSLQPPGP